MNIEYLFKPRPETVRAIGIAVLVAVMTTVASTDFTQLASWLDWKVWLIGTAAGAVHALAVAVLAHLGTGGIAADTGGKALPRVIPMS